MTHKNNFDFLRLLFATLVLITHSYALTGIVNHPTAIYLGDTDHLYILTNRQLTFSAIGLSGFFTISGYLIYESIMRAKSIFKYFRNRILRIYPGLIVAVLVTVILGAIVADVPLKEYFRSTSPYTYFISQLSLFFNSQYFIKGTLTHNKYPNVINGSLWTIGYEFIFYCLLSVLYVFKNKIEVSKILLFTAFTVSFSLYLILYRTEKDFLLYPTSLRAFYVFYFGMFFSSGALYSALGISRIFPNSYLLAIGLTATIFSIICNALYLVKCIVLPLVFIPFGLLYFNKLKILTTKLGGDISYGVYVYGFLIQQVLMRYFHFFYWHLAVVSIVLSYMIGSLSWKYVERPILMKGKK